MCYNKDTERGKATRKKGKPTRASKTFPTKTLTRKVCRFASNKCEPNPAGVKIKGLGRVKPNFFKKCIDKSIVRCYNKIVNKKFFFIV